MASSPLVPTLDVRVVAVLDPRIVAGAVDAALAAEAGGITLLQVRMKDSAAGEVLRWVERLRRALGVPVFVNDRADLARLAGAAGVHVGQTDLPVASVRALPPPALLVGLSVGTPDEARRALADPPDYWSVGPAFPTATKPDAGAALGVQGVATLAALAPAAMPVVAIGGITPDRVAALRTRGIAGVAAAGAVFGSGNVEAAARALRDAVDAGA